MSNISEVKRAYLVGKNATIKGFVDSIRKSKKNIFIVVRDPTGVIQCVSKEGDAAFGLAERLSRESSVELSGKIKEDKRSIGGYEIGIEAIKIYGLAEPFPLKKGHKKKFLFDNRHLWFRSKKVTAVMKVRSTVFRGIHAFFDEDGFYEIQSPSFVETNVEHGSALFEVNYFEKKAYLTQSWQLYAEAMVNSLWKIYTVAPSFRAERSRTWRHLTEFWHAEAEVAFLDNSRLMDIEEALVKRVIKEVLANNEPELKLLGRDETILKNTLSKPFQRLKYESVIDLANQKGLKLDYHSDLGSDEERIITRDLETPMFVFNYPTEIKPFYHKPDPQDPKHVLCNDLLAPEGYGEIIGAGQRIDDTATLIKRINDAGLDIKDYQWYVDLRRYGAVPHSGFGLGVDRLVLWLCKLPHIMYAVPFPRTMRRILP